MKLIRKGSGRHHARRGIIGVESAIVMIAFVIVVAALAFVVLNMGFSTTQKPKTSIIASLGGASSSLEIAGKVVGIGDETDGYVNVISIPIKIASGGDTVNIENSFTSVKYLSNNITYDNIYTCPTLSSGTFANITLALNQAVTNNCINMNAASRTTGNGNANQTVAIVYFSVNRNNNSILDSGEHAVLAIQYAVGERPAALDIIRAKILTAVGATLTVERQVPNISNFVVDLG